MIESPEEFIFLRNSEIQEEYTRASHEDAPEHVWEILIEQHPDMREWVALNKTVPVGILGKLANDINPSIRSTVAMKRKLTLELFRKLAKDDDSSVRHRIACNRKAPREVLEKLSDDLEPFVSEVAKQRLKKGA